MELGLFSESSLKDVSFVNLSDDAQHTVDADSAEEERQDLAAKSSDVEASNRAEEGTASCTPWPFVHEARNSRVALTKSVRKRAKRKRRWTKQKKPKSLPLSEAARWTVDDASDLSVKKIASSFVRQASGRDLGVRNNPARFARGNLSQFYGRSLGDRSKGRGRPSRGYRAAHEDETRRGTRENTSTRKTNQVDYSDARYPKFCESKEELQKNQLDILDSKYFLKYLRIQDHIKNLLGDAPSYNVYEDIARSASLVPRNSREVVTSSSETESSSICKSTPLKKRGREASSQRKNYVRSNSNRAARSDVPQKRGRRRKRERRDSVESNDRDASRIACISSRKSPRRESDSRGNSSVDERHQRRGMRRRLHAITKATYGRKENSKSITAAIAIMRDIQAHIRDKKIANNIRTPEIRADSPGEERNEGSHRDISMEYDWDCDESELRTRVLSRNAKCSSTDADSSRASSTNVHANRKFGKRKSHKQTIDCKFVDRTETTYRSAFHECVDENTPSLKINVDASWSGDSDVGTNSSWPRSSLIEEHGNEFDSTLPLVRRIVSDDERRGDGGDNDDDDDDDDEPTTANMCYKYRETSSSPTRDTFTGAEAGVDPDSARDKTFVNRHDTMKDMVTYRKKKKRSTEISLLLNDNIIWEKLGKNNAKVQTRGTRSAPLDRSQANSTQGDADDKRNNSECDSDKKEYKLRRLTRASIKTTKENCVGKLVWGHCSGWWPAVIIDAEHVGMVSEAGKMWVYWIGESQISLLNEKTQIEPFSRKLEDRLALKFRKNSRSQAIDETIQMLRQRYECTLTKPYYYWIRRNIASLEELDNLNFYPYPSKMQERLDCLKEKNAKATEQYILSQRNSPEPKKPIVEKLKDNKGLSKQMEDDHLPLQEQNPGIITWAKISGHNWWPAMIIDYRDCCLKEPTFACQWIMWYGEYTVSQVHHLMFLRFHKGLEKMHDYIQNTKKHVYLVGVLQASKDYCSRLGCNTDNWTLTNVFKYFSDMNNMHVPYNHLQVSESNKVYDKYSDEILNKINKLKSNPNVDDKRKKYIKESDALRRVMLGESTVEKLCLKCLKFSNSTMEEHPFFIGSLCKECASLFKPCMFVFGDDGKCFYCTVCADMGTVVICDREDCPRVYCTACLKFLICKETYENMLLEDPWECPLCRDESKLPANAVLHPRLNWKEELVGMFRTSSNRVSNNPVVSSQNNKRALRVLSLFDGLSTGLLVLLNLGIVVEVYYASEIDKDALMISIAHFGDRIKHLGDVREITKEKLKEIAPIDLLIGGSPCNDLSLVNPARLGLHNPKGTGVLFFEYCRILKQLKRINKDRQLFWLFENVASMPSEYRLEINEHLGQEPVVIDSADFSPQHRLRLYWHNFPFDPYLPLLHKQQDVQDILTPHCSRYALVKKIRTVTTKTNSLKQGKSVLKPIIMNGESDTIWITELEEIFGFPRHYTDVKNLSATNRQRLIGKSWSVQTLTALLQPLCSLFKCNTDETS